MLKYLAVFTVILLVTQTPVPASRQAPDNGADNKYTQNQGANTSNNPTADLVSPRAKKGNSPTLKPEPDKGTPNRDQPNINITVSTPVPISWGVREWFAWGANLALVLVGIGGIWVAVCTLRRIERQTKATEDSITLQEVAYYQWVEVNNWKTSISSGDGVPRLIIGFDILNSTNFPLTLKGSSLKFVSLLPPARRIIIGRFLPPGTPVHCEDSVEIGDEKKSSFVDNNLNIVIAININFESVRKEVISQSWDVTLNSGTEKTVFANGPMTRTCEGCNKEKGEKTKKGNA